MPPQAEPRSQPPESPAAGASLNEWLSYLESIHPTEIELGLDRVLLVLRRLFRCKPAARIVTVAGTNGKGSTVACLEQLLAAAGRTTGVYTSPHLQRYNERVRINGTEVTDAQLVSAFEQVEAARGNVTLTYFEFGTLAAFVVFKETGVNDWVLEVGLGGRLDAVNVMDPDLAVITSIDIDHTAFLGNDRESIGFEKAGILRPAIPAVLADPDPPRSVIQQAAAQKVQLEQVGRDYWLEADESNPEALWLIRADGKPRVALPKSPLPVSSVAAAVVAIQKLEPKLEPELLTRVVYGVRFPGRFEQMASSPDIFVDVGHNPHAARWLASQLQLKQSSGRRIYAVYAALADKDVEGVTAAMLPVVDGWFLGGLDCPRGLSDSMLAERMSAVAGFPPPECANTVTAALALARRSAKADDLIVVFGSFFTVAEAREQLGMPAS